MNVGQTSDKQAVLERLLGLGMVLVAFDARIEGVEVPDHLARDPQLRLNLSYRFGRPLKIDRWGVDAELTFGGVPFACRVPLQAIYLVISHVNGEPFLFPDHVPPELLTQASGSLEGLAARSSPSRKPQLSLVARQSDEPTADRAPEPKDEFDKKPTPAHQARSKPKGEDGPEVEVKHEPAAHKPRRRGHLRVIK